MALMVLAKKKVGMERVFCAEVLVGYIKEKSFLFCFVFSLYKRKYSLRLSYSRYIIIEVKARYWDGHRERPRI